MIWPEITKDTPVEEVVRIHRMIWDYVIKYGYKPDTLYINNCAFCEYGWHMAKDNDDCYFDSWHVPRCNMCKYCPGDWTHEDIPAGSKFACERNDGLFYRWNHDRFEIDGQNIAKEFATQIRDIPIRKDI